MFKLKTHPNGTVSQYKAWLVAKGFHQQVGVDFSETYITPTTICVVLAVALAKGWAIRQLDINNAFLNHFLKEDIYMEQLPGFHQSKGNGSLSAS